MKQFIKTSIAFLLSSTIVFSGIQLELNHSYEKKNDLAISATSEVKNVIMMIPDGFSTSQATNYRLFKGKKKPIWDAHLVGMIKTHSANNWVTDSAAAATAMATGQKTNNGMIGMKPNGEHVESILKIAKNAGKATGLVATANITHATPAAYAAHVESRKDEIEIAQQMLESADVLLGGGKEFFLPKSEGGQQRNHHLIREAIKNGYEILSTKAHLQNISSPKILGLFSSQAMAPAFQRSHSKEPSLKDMTKAAIRTLNQDKKGFFLMVEGSQIDWAGHANDAAWLMKETEAFEEAVNEAIKFAKKDKNTLVVIVGDHDTGGMSVGGYDVYKANPSILKNVKATGNFIATQIKDDRSNAANIMLEYADLILTKDELKQIEATDDVSRAINQIVSKRAFIGWTTTQHTGGDVPIFAFGPQSERFNGLHDNTDIPKEIAKAMKLRFD
ncbi:alkaline phosphatase [Halalkalibacterium ligniniphilum]|uniref:alkaline phosphatase n=1 Tax=Halalkalibacterium ligniniphilum TaxID=1134413 RepID=UPI00034C079F|nr:alkaline phosphatase [Halalkalibacterium ligniniphilum]